MTHRFILAHAKTDEDRERLNRELLGPPSVNRPLAVDPRAGFVPPSWWKGDEYASRSGMAAVFTLTRRRG